MKPKKTKSGKYHMTIYIGMMDGKKKFKSITATTYRECMLKATEYINDHPVDGSNLTVRQAVEKYIESKENVLSPSTIREYNRILRHDLEPINDVLVDKLDNYTLQSFVNSMEVGPKSIANRYRFLMSAIGMHSDKKYKVTLPTPQEPTRTVATEKDIKLLLDNAGSELRKAILLGSCSLRRGEICALKYSDLSEDTIYVHADMVQDTAGQWIYKDHAKTPQSTRHITVSPQIIQALGQGQGYVVDLTPNALYLRFRRLRNKLGINISLHSLRRFYASISHALGIPDKYIMAQGGWKTSTVMKRSYQQPLPTKEKEFAEKFSNSLNNFL